MSTIQNEIPTCVILAHDRSIAELIVPPDMPREQITREWCRLQLRCAGVELTSDTERIIERLVAHPPSPAQEARIVVARATPAVHGEDGTLQWLVDEKSQAPETPAGSINFYDRSPYTLVKQGQLLGFITDPTPGQDGRDVTGRTIPARPGKAVKLQLDETILRDARGQLTSAHRLATDSFNAQAYVSLLSRARIDREFPANRESLYAFGLAPALLRIVAMDDGGSVLVDLTVGDQTPDGFGRYIMVPGDSNVLIIPDYQVKEALRALQTRS